MKSVHLVKRGSYRNRFITIIILAGISLCWNKGFGQLPPENHIRELNIKYKAAKTDSLKIEALSQLAQYYSEYLGEKRLADSISQEAVEIAQASFRPQLLLMAYNSYLANNDLGLYEGKALRYAGEANRLSKMVNNPILEWNSYRSLVELYLSAYKYEKALGFSFQALSQADAMSNDELKAESYLLVGRSMEGNNQKIEAFRNYLNATGIAERIKKTKLLQHCYSQLSSFYNFNKLYDKAIAYKLKEVSLISQAVPVDSVSLMWKQFDLQSINVNSNKNTLSIKSVEDVLSFAARNKLWKLKNYEIALYRSYMVEADRMDLLYDFYNVKYPGELIQLSRKEPALYCRLKAYFCEVQHRTDSAFYYLEKAENLLKAEPNKILLSKFYYRYGQFLERQGKNAEAISKFTRSYQEAKTASYFEYMLNASQNLEKIYRNQQDYHEAYNWSAVHQALDDSIKQLTENDQLMRMEIDHESKKQELMAEQERKETVRRHNIQYTAITIVIFTLFILLLMLGSLKVPEWSIKMLGFFSFILFFEFIIMIADHKIYEVTANEPWKILLIKIGLIAFLLPFHHWIEKQVIHYLINHKLIDFKRISPLNIRRRHIEKQKDLVASEV
ncbi:MAG: hypothetical protein HXX13_02380 [Bacteroidetes bacterium]|nr:hypothetical protein [Bacteroidota bacterium]